MQGVRCRCSFNELIWQIIYGLRYHTALFSRIRSEEKGKEIDFGVNNYCKFDKSICMKSKQQVKEELHKLIDSIEDEETLNVLNEDVVPYVIEKRNKEQDGEEELTKEQEEELDEAIRQADAGEVISWEELLKETKKWHTK